MNDKLFEEDLSISYLRAIAAQAEVTFELNHRDGEGGFDVDLRKITETDNNEKYLVEFAVQLKATYSKNLYSDDGKNIKYKLKSKNYNDLCTKGTKNIILCLLILPEQKEDWITQKPDELIMKKCMYWLSLQKNTPTKNKETVTITIPKSNILSVEVLKDMVHTVANGGLL